ncbi:glucose-6-phosphate isomerase [Clostridium sp. C105KSO13]|uniref:glucose-6-phosphate isomerase n=1 Tax=Clostridium sp. C105KSO13 TaxID=1776045 RepID=UPI0007407ED1|nr:glucose-6-phosphate isomerase [Clostridium sp. C105KSO13]CUX37292.1 Glucose-6-phosphate isomerase [Clostridium sp. C105KSO13]
MASKVTFDYSKASSFIQEHEMEYMSELAAQAKDKLVAKTGAGNDFLGWIDLPVNYDKEEFARIGKAAEQIRSDSEVLLVIGIGGSYLGARAAIDFLGHSFANVVSKDIRKSPEIYYVGNSISSAYIKDLADVVGDRDFSINMISKSGTTTEPAIAFRVFKEILEKKYGKEGAAKRIYATTDKEKGALKNLAAEEGYETFVVPDDVGGRFSVLTAVGLLPIAVSGADITKLMEGAQAARKEALENDFAENGAMQYAAVRNILLRKGKTVEVLANYEPSLHYVSEWWKQLCGESEGKDQRGIFPASVDLTTDLHSMGQFIQDGNRILFETVLNVGTSKEEIIINEEPVDLDGLNYLTGKTVDFINKSAMNGTILAHTDGDVPNLMVTVPKQTEFYLGQLFYFFEFAIGISGYLLGVNPFNQPGVESYKRNMFALLGKPGYEKEREELLKRL